MEQLTELVDTKEDQMELIRLQLQQELSLSFSSGVASLAAGGGGNWADPGAGGGGNGGRGADGSDSTFLINNSPPGRGGSAAPSNAANRLFLGLSFFTVAFQRF